MDVEDGRKKEGVGMRPLERVWDCVYRPSLCKGEVIFAVVSACSEDIVSEEAMMIVGEMERVAAARGALGPATLLIAREAWVKSAASVQQRT